MAWMQPAYKSRRKNRPRVSRFPRTRFPNTASARRYIPPSMELAPAGVNIETKSGTNEYHGSVYEYFRNNLLDARSFIDFDPFGNPVRPPFRMNQYGLTLGGPITRGKTFSFSVMRDSGSSKTSPRRGSFQVRRSVP